MNKPVLTVRNLCKDYDQKRVVNNVSFSLFSGEIFGFLGANGAGKSTTIKMITGLTGISSGNVEIMGYQINRNFEKAIENIGAMIETPTLYPYMSGLANLKYFASLYPNIPQSKIYEVASLVGLSARIKDKVSSYSLGMKQRLGIAQALLHSPKILILDEPTNGLDANGIKEIRELLIKLAKHERIAILISSHILSEMENLCTKIAIINNGNIVEYKTMNEIKQSVFEKGSTYVKVNAPNFAGKLIEQNLNATVFINKDKVIFNATDSKLAEIIMLLTKNKISVYGAGDVDVSLEDIFLNVLNQHNNSTAIS